MCVVVSTAVFAVAGNAVITDPLTVESTFKVSGSGTAFSASVSIFDQWDVNDVRLGINSDPIIGGFGLKFAKDGVITFYNLGIADVNYHTYKIEYDGSNVKIYIDNMLKKTLSITLTDIKIALHTNARAIGDTVSAQFDNIDISVDEFIFTDDFEDGTIDPIWIVWKADWMSVTEQQGVLDMTGTATEQFWENGGGAVILISDIVMKVVIDIKPDSFPNSINLKSKGNVPVAILSDSAFDATTVDPDTVVFAGALPLPIGESPEDVNGDGLLDVILHFKTQGLDIQPGDTEDCLNGMTFDGQEFKGCDSIRIIRKD